MQGRKIPTPFAKSAPISRNHFKLCPPAFELQNQPNNFHRSLRAARASSLSRQGHPIIARRFNGGSIMIKNQVPSGTKDCLRTNSIHRSHCVGPLLPPPASFGISFRGRGETFSKLRIRPHAQRLATLRNVKRAKLLECGGGALGGHRFGIGKTRWSLNTHKPLRAFSQPGLPRWKATTLALADFAIAPHQLLGNNR